MSVADDRVVVPLTRLTLSANTLCALVCPSFLGPHDEDCLLSLLEEREALLATAATAGQVSGDCLDPVKHGACSGCVCSCHLHSLRAPHPTVDRSTA